MKDEKLEEFDFLQLDLW